MRYIGAWNKKKLFFNTLFHITLLIQKKTSILTHFFSRRVRYIGAWNKKKHCFYTVFLYSFCFHMKLSWFKGTNFQEFSWKYLYSPRNTHCITILYKIYHGRQRNHEKSKKHAMITIFVQKNRKVHLSIQIFNKLTMLIQNKKNLEKVSTKLCLANPYYNY